MHLNPKHLSILGWLATACAIAMYFSFIDQILLNLSGKKGSILLPLATILNCCLWIAYGFFRPKKDYPMIVANFPGIVLGAITFFTAL